MSGTYGGGIWKGEYYSYLYDDYTIKTANTPIIEVDGYNEDTETACILLLDTTKTTDKIVGVKKAICEMIAKKISDGGLEKLLPPEKKSTEEEVVETVYNAYLNKEIGYIDLCFTVREKLLYLLSVLDTEEGEIQKYENACELKMINDILSLTCEDEVFFDYGIAYKELETVLDEQYKEENMDAENCYMFYEAADTKGKHTYMPVQEIKDRLYEAEQYVKSKQ